MSRASAFVRQKCPRCRQGPIFRGWVEVHKVCPVCGLVLERESGYFLGAMYFSYFLSVALLVILVQAVRRLTGIPLERALLVSILCFVPLVPFNVRLSRLIWIYIDQKFDPGT